MRVIQKCIKFKTSTGKERDSETGFSYFGARYYDSDLMTGWISVDPMADKYPNISPYAYCAWNPIKLVDPDGEKVKPANEEALLMIRNTLPKDAHNYVQIGKDGFIDSKILAGYSGNSSNFESLKALVNDDLIIEVLIDNKYTYANSLGELKNVEMPCYPFDPQYNSFKDLNGTTMGGVSTGEEGFLGKTLFPDRAGLENSPNENMFLIINSNLSSNAKAEIFSHEAYGHALLYLKNGHDHDGASHNGVNGKETNIKLKEMILKAKQETIKNMSSQ